MPVNTPNPNTHTEHTNQENPMTTQNAPQPHVYNVPKYVDPLALDPNTRAATLDDRMHAAEQMRGLYEATKRQNAQEDYENQRKSEPLVYALWFFLGVLGGHRFYTRDTGLAVGQLLTLGGLGFWTLIDVFFIGRRVRELNQQIRREVNRDHGVGGAL